MKIAGEENGSTERKMQYAANWVARWASQARLINKYYGHRLELSSNLLTDAYENGGSFLYTKSDARDGVFGREYVSPTKRTLGRIILIIAVLIALSLAIYIMHAGWHGYTHKYTCIMYAYMYVCVCIYRYVWICKFDCIANSAHWLAQRVMPSVQAANATPLNNFWTSSSVYNVPMINSCALPGYSLRSFMPAILRIQQEQRAERGMILWNSPSGCAECCDNFTHMG